MTFPIWHVLPRLFRAALACCLLVGQLVGFQAQAGWGWVPCPKWTYGWEVTPTQSTWKYLLTQFTYSCIGGVACVPQYPNPSDVPCAVTLDPQCYTNNHQTVTATARDGLINTTPIEIADSQGFYHCAAFSSVNTFKDFGNNDNDCPLCKGNPVNIGVGNKFQREVDITAPAEGGLEMVRYYNAMAPAWQFAMGNKWTHTWSRSVKLMTNTEAYAFRPDGKVYSYRLVAGVWGTDADTPDVLTQTSGGWTLATRTDDIETYNADGQLTSIKTRSGLLTTVVYSDGTASGPNGAYYDNSTTRALIAGNLLRVVDFRGRVLQFLYNTDGTVVKVVDQAGNIYRYGYDSLGNLQTVTYPDTKVRTYIYNESANTSGANLGAHMTGITDENAARFATFKYLSNGQAYYSGHAGGVDVYNFTYNTGSTTFTDPIGSSRTSNITTVLGVAQVSGTTQTCSGCGGTTSDSYTYDANRNITSHKDFNGILTCYTFDTSRDLETARTEGLSGSGTCASRVTTSATRTITTDWHSSLRLQRRIAEPLGITTFAYNGDTGVSCAPTGASNALPCSKTVQATTDATGASGFAATADGSARVWTYTYNINGQLLTVDGPRTDVSDVTTYVYYTSNDVSGNYRIGDLASVTDALGHTTQFNQYDANGRLKKKVDPNGLETIFAYHSRGWLSSSQTGSAASGYETTTYDYDGVGQLAKTTLPDASYVSYTYDDAHRLTQIQDGLGNKIVYTLDNAGNRLAENAYDVSATLVRTHTRVIDALNRVKQEIGGTSPTTQITQQGYDGENNLTTLTDPLSRVTTQIFDARNRLIEVRDPLNGSLAPTKYEYNGQDRITKVTDPAGLATTYTVNGHGETLTQVSPDTGTTTFTFDAASNVATKVDARNVSASYAYDSINRLTQITYPDETVTFTYDTCTNGVGRLCSISDNSGTTSYAFDVHGRVTSKNQTMGSITKSMGYAYNAAGQLATLTTPSGKSVVYTYANNRPVSVAVDGTSVANTVFYEPFGPNGGWHWGNSTASVPNTHVRLFDKDFRITRVTSDLPSSGTQPYFDKRITWDAQSRVTQLADNANTALTATYGFDALDRITSVAQGSSSWGYTYSGVGDRLTAAVGASSTSYAYPSTSHMLQSLSGATTKSFTYDSAGNQTSDGSTTWTYAGNNRPTQAGSTTFAINALGQRVKKATGSTATYFAYDEQGRLWGEYDSAGALIQETIWLDDLPVATVRSGVNYVHSDHLSTPRMVTRASDNAIEWRWDNTEAFGNSAADENPSSLGVFAYNLRFPGQYFDVETGKHYNYFRDYDGGIGRYVESDPIGLRGGINTYAYVRGDPLRLTDQRGLANGPWGNPNFTPGNGGFGFDGNASLGFGGAGFLGPGFGSADSGAAIDSKGHICFYTSTCAGGGSSVAKAQGGLALVGAIGKGELCTGTINTKGGYWTAFGEGIGGEGIVQADAEGNHSFQRGLFSFASGSIGDPTPSFGYAQCTMTYWCSGS